MPDFSRETSGFFPEYIFSNADDTTLFLATVHTCSLEISVCQNTSLLLPFIKPTLELHLLSFIGKTYYFCITLKL